MSERKLDDDDDDDDNDHDDNDGDGDDVPKNISQGSRVKKHLKVIRASQRARPVRVKRPDREVTTIDDDDD